MQSLDANPRLFLLLVLADLSIRDEAEDMVSLGSVVFVWIPINGSPFPFNVFMPLDL